MVLLPFFERNAPGSSWFHSASSCTGLHLHVDNEVSGITPLSLRDCSRGKSAKFNFAFIYSITQQERAGAVKAAHRLSEPATKQDARTDIRRRKELVSPRPLVFPLSFQAAYAVYTRRKALNSAYLNEVFFFMLVCMIKRIRKEV